MIVAPSLFVAFLWSIQTVVQKHTLNHLSREASFMIFSVVYATFMLFFIGFNRQVIIKDLPNITKPMIIIVVAATVLNFLGNFIYYKLLKHNGVSLVSSMTSVAPLFVALLAYFAFGETLKMKQMLGIAAITGGVFLIS